MDLRDFKFYKETKKDHETGLTVNHIFEQYRGWFEELYGRDLSKFYMLKEFVVIDGNYHYPPHTDSSMKVVSSVLYVSDKGQGTRLSKNAKMEEPYQIEWKPNRLMTFSRTKDTWHDYFCDRKRVTFNLVFLKKNIEEEKQYAMNPTMDPETAKLQGLTFSSEAKNIAAAQWR
jgi:hypothetical protein